MTPVTLIVALVVSVIAAIALFAAFRPDEFSVQRSLLVQAPVDVVFAYVNDLRAHELWNPFDKPDPAMSKIHSGPAQGTGAVYEWVGGKAGTGRLSILDATPFTRIQMQLEMMKPIKATNSVVFSFVPRNEGTEVTWKMHGPAPYFTRLLHLVFNVDHMVGRQFETGLLQLRQLAEARK